MSGTENVTVVRRLIEAFNTGDIANIDKLVAPEYLNHES